MNATVKGVLGAGIFILLLLPTAREAQGKEIFEVPDVKEDFCGVHINFQYCRCAFHNEQQHCNAVNLKSGEARIHLANEFRTWVGDQMEAFARQCIARGYDWSRPTMACLPRASGSEPAGQALAEQYGLPDMRGVKVPAKNEVAGRVAVAQGEIFLYSAAFQRWVGPIASGQPVYRGDYIITKRGGGTVILYGDRGEDFVELAPETFFETPAPLEPDDPLLLGILKQGVLEMYDALTADEKKAPSGYRQMRTTTITTGIRGTNFILVHDVAGTSEVFLKDGSVEVGPHEGGESVTLATGQSYRHEKGNATISTLELATWEAKAQSLGLSGVHRTATEEDLERPVGNPVDPDVAKFTREELVGDLSFADDQLAPGMPWRLAVAAGIVASAGIAFYYLKRRKHAASPPYG
jgi:hypothetical protein